MKETIKHTSIKVLENNNDWMFGGQLSRIVSGIHECKESNAERRFRELQDEGRIQSRYVPNPKGHNKVVQYKIKHKDTLF